MIITSGENIGIVRATNVRSRYVTAAAGVILILIALSAPLGRLASAIPSAVVGGTAMVVFAIIGTMGIDMLRKVDLHERGNMFVLAGALTMGLLPIVVPGLYSRFPTRCSWCWATAWPWARSRRWCSTWCSTACRPTARPSHRRRNERRALLPFFPVLSFHHVS